MNVENLSARFSQVTKEFDQEVAASLQRMGARWVKLAQAQAPRRSGAFASGLSYELFSDDEAFGFYGTSPQPLGSYIKFGTRPHPIAARNARALKFYWTRTGLNTIVPKRGGFKTHRIGDTLFIGKGRVDHPGTQANPYHVRAFEQFWPEVEKEVRAVGAKFVLKLASPNE